MELIKANKTHKTEKTGILYQFSHRELIEIRRLIRLTSLISNLIVRLILGIRTRTLRMKGWRSNGLSFWLVGVGMPYIAYGCQATIGAKTPSHEDITPPLVLLPTLQVCQNRSEKGEGKGERLSPLFRVFRILPSSRHHRQQDKELNLSGRKSYSSCGEKQSVPDSRNRESHSNPVATLFNSTIPLESPHFLYSEVSYG